MQLNDYRHIVLASAFRIVAIAALGIGIGTVQVHAQSDSDSEAEEATVETGEEPAFVMPRSGPFSPQTIAIPNSRAIGAWARSGHSDASAEAFRHWDEDGEIPPVCAVCHSGAGFRSFHGLDGTDPGIEGPVAIGGVVDCETCHNPQLGNITEITLPSGVVHPVSGAEAACTTCHQGRAAGATVEKATGDLPADEVNEEIGFINPHYALAASTNLGGYGQVGYQYPGKDYSGRFMHAKPITGCVSCHSPHSLSVREDTCLTCHTTSDSKAIRISRFSFDGSGDTTKGIATDIQANADLLMSMIQDYASDVVGTAIIFDGAHYPYFYADANGDGVIDQAEGRNVAYNTWTPRLVKSVFNWKVVTADPGIHAHNPHYALELLYDSIEDLSGPLNVDMASLGLLR
ncbi:cytochrome C [Pseudoruegeria sp. HB172150]|uniref:cytochrome C n=1 Tax=Pseudoruegeria sp. HB172150 TaxID=2721164 RepID=UPI0015556AFE|nr:cytochrome C [Pseudoruegeria sp. HB172150]